MKLAGTDDFQGAKFVLSLNIMKCRENFSEPAHTPLEPNSSQPSDA